MTNHDKTKNAKTPQRLAHRLWRRVVRPLFFLLLVVWTIRLTIADWRDVPSGSMEPTIQIGDRILVNLLAYDLRVPFTRWTVTSWSSPSRGDLVVFQTDERRHTMVKRIIGLPGDAVEVRDGAIHLNGASLHYDWPADPTVPVSVGALGVRDDQASPRIGFETIEGRRHAVLFDDELPRMRTTAPIVVPPGYYYVMGDNRDHSRDSRVIGAISREQILGKVYCVAFSVDLSQGFNMREDRWFRTIR